MPLKTTSSFFIKAFAWFVEKSRPFFSLVGRLTVRMVIFLDQGGKQRQQLEK
jgi:hypothetical protein